MKSFSIMKRNSAVSDILGAILPLKSLKETSLNYAIMVLINL